MTAVPTARARTDERDWLIEAEEPLAGLQRRSGGDLPGIIASPALLELVRKSRLYGLKLAASIRAQDDHEQVDVWVEVAPAAQGEGCTIDLSSWRTTPLSEVEGVAAMERRSHLARELAELSARLGLGQEVLTVDAIAADAQMVAKRMRASLGRPWTEFITLQDGTQPSLMHWRLLDGVRVRLEGSDRHWQAHLAPLGVPIPGSAGFELFLVPDEPIEEEVRPPAQADASTFNAAISREIAPVLRQPIARIIANAETIRTQLAGPVADEYSAYAADIASAGEHLLALIDDLADLEVVEDEEFTTTPDRIDLTDVARRAAGILGVRAQERGIAILPPERGESLLAIGEFRRVLQILLNLIGNAIRYSPEGSHIRLVVDRREDRARIVVADEGVGLTVEQQARVFEKFERLGRSGDGGSGLGLYISRRLARAMDGDLKVESAPGEGARFALELPSFDERRSAPR